MNHPTAHLHPPLTLTFCLLFSDHVLTGHKVLQIKFPLSFQTQILHHSALTALQRELLIMSCKDLMKNRLTAKVVIQHLTGCNCKLHQQKHGCLHPCCQLRVTFSTACYIALFLEGQFKQYRNEGNSRRRGLVKKATSTLLLFPQL